MTTLYILLAVIIGYILISVFIAKNKQLQEKYHLSFSGPCLLIHTVKGRNLIDRLSKWRIWKIFGNVSIFLCIFLMIFMVFMLVWIATLIPKISHTFKPTPQMMIGIPGINPFIPITYGWLALIIGVAVHELSHGLLARKANVNLKSMGLLFFVIPLGAFVEPDEEQLKNVSKLHRARVYGAGPGANFILALVCAMIFSWCFMGAVTPVSEGIIVSGIAKGFPAEKILTHGDLIVSFNDTSIKNISDFQTAIENTYPYQTVNISFYNKRTLVNTKVTLDNKYNYTHKEEDNGTGYLGISYFDASGFIGYLHRPFKDANSAPLFFGYSLAYIHLPLAGISPMKSPLIDNFVVTGYLSVLPVDIFWIIANVFYWIFWLNLMLGLTNALPAIPLDGGYIFKDIIDTFISKLSLKNKENYIKGITYTMSIFILLLILWQIIGTRL